jgi:chromosome partitioning protein
MSKGPFTISISALKGGVGKSILAVTVGCGFHRAGRKTLLVDADSQGTLRTWAGKGEGNDIPPVVAMDGRNLARDLARVGAAYELAVVDTPARLAAEARTAMVVADLVLLPASRGPAGLWALEETLNTLAEARGLRPDLLAYVVANRMGHTHLAELTRERLAELDVPVLEASLGDRVAFDEALGAGMDVVDYMPSSEAAKEAKALTRELTKIITKGHRR